MKKLPAILAATTLVASIGAYADVLKNNASPFAVKVPNIRSGFEINVEGLFLKPSNSDLDYGAVSILNSSTNDSQNNLLTVKPGTDFGWGVGIGYIFPDSGNDVRLNWTEFNHTDTDMTVPHYYNPDDDDSFDNYLITPFQTFRFFSGDVVSATGQAKFKLNAVDLDAGQYIDVGNRLQLRPFAGLRFARLESNLKGHYVNNENELHIDENYEDDALNSRFSGMGPLFGADATYNMGGGVSVVGHVATALLVGSTESSASLVESSSPTSNALTINANLAVQPPATAHHDASSSIKSSGITRVVPALEAKLGLNYSYKFECDSVMTFEGGYKVTEYIDVVDRIKTDFVFKGASVFRRTTNSVGFSGPYVKLSVKL